MTTEEDFRGALRRIEVLTQELEHLRMRIEDWKLAVDYAYREGYSYGLWQPDEFPMNAVESDVAWVHSLSFERVQTNQPHG